MSTPVYETIVEESNDGILVAVDGEIVYTNRRLQQLTGYSEDELDGAPKTRIVAPEHQDRVKTYHEQRRNGEAAPATYEVDFETKDDERIPIEMSVNDGEYEGEPASYAICRDISDRKQRENQLRDLTRKYESLFEGNQDPLFVMAVEDEQTVRYQQINSYEAELIGDSPGTVRGKTLQEVFGAEMGSTLQANFKRCIENREPITYEETWDTDDETTYWQTKLTPLKTNGEVTHIVGSSRDITDLKQQQTDLERSRQRLQALFDKTPDSIVVHDESGRVIDVNDRAAQSLGYSQAELVGMQVSAFEVGLSVSELQTHWKAMEVGETIRTDGSHERKDGSRFPVEVRVTKLEVDGEPRYLALARDMTEQRERQQEVETLKERLQLAVEGAGVGVWDWNMQTDAVEFNEQWATMLGYSPDEIDPHLDTWKDKTHPEDIGTVFEALEAHTQGETEYYDTDHRMQTADGDWKWIRTLGKIVDRDADGEPLRAVGLHIDVDEQKQQEKALTELRTRFETFAQTVNEAFFLLPIDFSETLYVNDAVERIYGVTPEEAHEDPAAWLKHIHPDDREPLRAAMNDFEAGRVTGMVSQRYRIQHPDRGLRWMETEMDVVTDESGTATQIAGITRDITERKQHEMELTQFQEAVDQTADAVCIVDASGDIEYTNATFEDLKDTIDATKLEKLPRIIKSETNDDPTVAKFWETVRAGNKWECEITAQQPTEDPITISQVVSPISDSSGEPQKFVAIARDITERKQYEQKLKSARKNLRDVIDLIPDIIALKDKDGRYLLANQTTAETYGITIEELEGTLEKDIIPSQKDSEKFRQDDLEVIESGEPKHIPEEELTTANGETKILQTTKIPYKTNGGGTDAVLLYARDITALKQYEQQLETQRDNLDLLNQVVRHDIRNDLQLIQAYGGMLAEVDSLSEQQQLFISKVLKAANNAVDLTTSARDLSEVMLRDETETKPMPLAQTVEQQVDRLQSETQSAIVTIDSSLPAVDVIADELLEAVFRNLLKNAVQHNDKDVPEITISASVDNHQVIVNVADNGPGVSDAHKTEIFGRGNQGLKSEGTGIGLYLVQTLVDRYGGSVWVEDNDPEGAVFSVQLQVDS